MAKKIKPIPVMLTVDGTIQGEDGEDDAIRMVTMGELTAVTGGYVLQYQESQPEENGQVTTQDIVLQLHPERVTMTRVGDFGTSMVFMKDRRFEGVYHTPYGDMDMAVYATRVHCKLGDDEGSVHLKYQLEMQGLFTAMHELKLSYVAGSGPSGHKKMA